MKSILLLILIYSFSTYAEYEVKIIKSGVVVNSNSDLADLAAADAWIADNEVNLDWGSKSSYTISKEDITADREAVRTTENTKRTAATNIFTKLKNGDSITNTQRDRALKYLLRKHFGEK